MRYQDNASPNAMHYLGLTRFDDTTWNENISWRAHHKWDGAAYGTPVIVANTIPHNIPLFVIEMHNSKKEIVGIGLIRNAISPKNHFKIYNEGNYNRYTYCSKYRIDRSEFSEKDKIYIKVLEQLLFKMWRLKCGYTIVHSMRGQGITRFPKVLEKNTKVCFATMFKQMFKVKYNAINDDYK